MGNFWKMRSGYMSRARYLWSSLFDVVFLLAPEFFVGHGGALAYFRMAVIVHMVLLGEYLSRGSLFDAEPKVRARYMLRSFVGMGAVFVALLAFKHVALLFLPLLMHRVYREMGTWLKNRSFDRISDLFLLSCTSLIAYMSIRHNPPEWDNGIAYMAIAASLVSWVSAMIAGKESALRDSVIDSKDRITAIHKFLISSVRSDVMAELGAVEDVCGDPDYLVPALVQKSLRTKWGNVDAILTATHADGLETTDIKKVLGLVRKFQSPLCSLVLSSWGECVALVNRGLLSALLRALVTAAETRGDGKRVTVWITVMSNRILVTDNSGSCAYDEEFVSAVTSDEFEAMSGMDVDFETPIDKVNGMGGRVSIKI